MTDDIKTLCETEPEVADTVAKALRSTIDFYQTRGRLLGLVPQQLAQRVFQRKEISDVSSNRR